MPKVCCVPTCKLRSDDLNGLKKTFHTFPSDTALREKWIQQLKAKFANLSLPKYAYVCSSHFMSDCFYFTGLCKNLRLKQGSYPSIFSSFEENKLKEQCVEANTRLIGKTIGLVEAVYSELVDTCTNEVPNKRSQYSQVESDEENCSNSSMCVPEFSAAELSNEAKISESNPPEKLSKSCVKSLINLDIDSLDVSKDLKDILRNSKAQLINLRRKNKTLQMKLYRWKKGVKTGNSLLLHLKHRKLVNEKIVDSLKVSNI